MGAIPSESKIVVRSEKGGDSSPSDSVKRIREVKNCLIFGSGRSGTSMLGGILYEAGYFMGNDLYPPRRGNLKGFFETAEINGINEKILEEYDKRLQKFLKKFTKNYTVHCPASGQRWLMSLPVTVTVNNENEEITNRIVKAIYKTPFAYKDPRFSYTLPVWRRYLEPDTVFICVFREPNITVKSILKECASERYLKSLKIDQKAAYGSWLNMYSHILKKHFDNKGQFVFVHYNQIYSGSALPMLSNKLGVELKQNFVERELKRTRSDSYVPHRIMEIYSSLCELADYREALL